MIYSRKKQSEVAKREHSRVMMTEKKQDSEIICDLSMWF